MNTQVTFAIDGGGTTTRLAIASPCRSTSSPTRYPSINPASVDPDEAIVLLRSALSQVALVAKAANAAVQGVIASAAISPYTLARWRTAVWDLMQSLELSGSVVLINDIDALLVAPPVNGRGGVLVAGTGSGAMIAAADGTVVRVGGWEYLASDEGGAFWLGRAGLAAAVRGIDGRGGRTTVAARIEAEQGKSVGDVARTLAELPYPRQAVAELAPCVLDAWREDGDEVATSLVAMAVAELTHLISAGVSRVGEPPPTWALTGGLTVMCDDFAQLIRASVTTVAPGASVHIIAEPVLAILQSVQVVHYPAQIQRVTVTVT